MDFFLLNFLLAQLLVVNKILSLTGICCFFLADYLPNGLATRFVKHFNGGIYFNSWSQKNLPIFGLAWQWKNFFSFFEWKRKLWKAFECKIIWNYFKQNFVCLHGIYSLSKKSLHIVKIEKNKLRKMHRFLI